MYNMYNNSLLQHDVINDCLHLTTLPGGNLVLAFYPSFWEEFSVDLEMNNTVVIKICLICFPFALYFGIPRVKFKVGA